MDTINIKCWNKELAIVLQDDNSIYLEIQDDTYKCLSPLIFEHTNFLKESIREIDNIGILSDVLSGAYGSEFFKRYYFNEFGKQANIIKRLSFIGDHGIGALEFTPNSRKDNMIDLKMSLNDFKEESIKVYSSQDSDIAYLIARSNSGAGGAKAKWLIKYNPISKEVHIGEDNSLKDKGFIDALIKFNTKRGSEADLYNEELRLEYVYYLLAQKVGLIMSESFLENDDNGNSYFITKRFDIDSNGDKFHIHSLAGLYSHDASPLSMGYENLFRTANLLSIPNDDKLQIFKTMVFNLVFANRDDHSRNFSFKMDKDCNWSYAPAYDLTYSASNCGLTNHQLTINKKMVVNNIRELSINKISKLLNIDNPLDIFSQMIDVKNKELRKLCKQYNISPETVDNIFNDTKDIDNTFKRKKL